MVENRASFFLATVVPRLSSSLSTSFSFVFLHEMAAPLAAMGVFSTVLEVLSTVCI
jgi:hypothetical protein